MYVTYEIADRIKALADSKGIQLKHLLIQCDLNKNTFSNMKKSFISVESIAKIADVLDCSIDYLMGRTEKEEVNK